MMTNVVIYFSIILNQKLQFLMIIKVQTINSNDRSGHDGPIQSIQWMYGTTEAST